MRLRETIVSGAVALAARQLSWLTAGFPQYSSFNYNHGTGRMIARSESGREIQKIQNDAGCRYGADSDQPQIPINVITK